MQNWSDMFGFVRKGEDSGCIILYHYFVGFALKIDTGHTERNVWLSDFTLLAKELVHNKRKGTLLE